jgi:hypothetical protein
MDYNRLTGLSRHCACPQDSSVVIMCELKTAKGKTTPAQDDWLERLSPHVECYLWRPDDIDFISTRLSQC